MEISCLQFWTNSIFQFCASDGRMDTATAVSLKEREISLLCLELSCVSVNYTGVYQPTTLAGDIFRGVRIAQAEPLVIKPPPKPPCR